MIALLGAGGLLLTSRYWLPGLGALLVYSEEPFHADIVVVLAGDDTGARILRGAELVKQGYAPAVVVSGPVCCYGKHESDLAIEYAVAAGYPREWFIPLPMVADSTREEAQIITRELERLKVSRFLLVTSDYHTRRAARVYRKLVPPGSFRTIAAESEQFGAGWWRTREGRKYALMEWIKTLAYWAGL
ncbi:MAG: YdcF family protein [Rhodospirillales bacterium]